MMATTDEYLTRQDAAALLKISERTLDRQRDLPRVKLTARRIVFRRSDVARFVEERAEKSAA